MCGIIGGVTNINFDSEVLLRTMEHRGPDNSMLIRIGDVFLGHTRLSIQDLSAAGNQPMFSECKNYVIVFNGEIYNHKEIRNEHLQEVNFVSSGDTETLLKLYIKYGEACLKLLNGIFTFSIYNVLKKEFFIARDHFGIKPLYVYKDENQFIFGSELKSFLGFGIKKTINLEAIENYLTFLWSPGEMTPFKNVKKILPGHYIKLSSDDFSILEEKVYYEKVPNGEYINLDERQLIDQLDKLLTKAVERQLLSDVPVGFFLSGGLDSTLLVAIAKKLQPDSKFPCFTIDVSGWDSGTDGFTDDLDYAIKAADYLDVDLSIVKADIDIVRNFDKMIWHLDEPLADAAPLNVMNIARLAKEKNIKILIGGAAGDDIFSGYRRHIALNFESFIEKIPLFLRRIFKQVCGYLPVRVTAFRRIKKFTANLDNIQQDRLIGYFDWMNSDEIKKLFKKDKKLVLDLYDSHIYFKKLLKKVKLDKNLLQKMLFLEVKTFLVDHNLNYTDKMSMAEGVEARVPYLDLDVFEFAQKIPPSLKMKGNQTKYILKKVAERYLPKEIIYRPKTGFGAPVRKWVTEEMDDMIRERLSEERIRQQGIFDFKAIEKIISQNKKKELDVSYNIWAVLAVTSWIEQFVHNKPQN